MGVKLVTIHTLPMASVAIVFRRASLLSLKEIRLINSATTSSAVIILFGTRRHAHALVTSLQLASQEILGINTTVAACIMNSKNRSRSLLTLSIVKTVRSVKSLISGTGTPALVKLKPSAISLVPQMRNSILTLNVPVQTRKFINAFKTTE